MWGYVVVVVFTKFLIRNICHVLGTCPSQSVRVSEAAGDQSVHAAAKLAAAGSASAESAAVHGLGLRWRLRMGGGGGREQFLGAPLGPRAH